MQRAQERYWVHLLISFYIAVYCGQWKGDCSSARVERKTQGSAPKIFLDDFALLFQDAISDHVEYVQDWCCRLILKSWRTCLRQWPGSQPSVSDSTESDKQTIIWPSDCELNSLATNTVCAMARKTTLSESLLFLTFSKGVICSVNLGGGVESENCQVYKSQ